MRWRVAIVAVLGVGLALYLLFYIGFAPVASAVARIGVHGFLWLCLYTLAAFPLLAAAWRVLLPAGSAAGFRVLAVGAAGASAAGVWIASV